ncbi:hypothetical protein GCM10023215_14490 [Pseudonocardia yuanmonensis]|uniref:DUF308 domain-containing protein n=1 Tax=Pseudonocardia yuanmonensis TaxID=1095914 RepID=A0ABP8W611_9PSEU
MSTGEPEGVQGDPGREGRRSDPDPFEQVVASWRAEGTVPRWPGDEPGDGPGTAASGPATTGPASTGPAATGTGATDPEPATERRAAPAPPPVPEIDPRLDPEEHYIPPEPPPLPRVGAAVGVGLVLVVLGIVLVAAPQWIGMSSVYGLPLGLVAIAGGLTWLLMRLWQPADEDVDPYDDEGTV